MKRFSVLIALVLAAAICAPANLCAQGGSTGAIAGVVTDEKGGVISGARIEVTNAETGVKVREVVSSGPGTYAVPLLTPGRYRLEVTASGFSKFIADRVLVQVTETTTVNMALKIGQITETVVVSAVEAPVNVSSAATGETIGAYTVSTLPLATRNYLTLLTLSAGANTEIFNANALGRGAVTINVNGQRPTNNNFTLDGINVNDINLPALDNVPLPNPETIQEFKTQTSLYDASQGRNGGGNVQANLRVGTDRYHGNAYEFLRNEDLNANDFFLNRDGVPRPRLRQNQYGASLGGPVPKIVAGPLAKDFFFFINFQITREDSGNAPGTFFTTNIPVLPATRDAGTLAGAFLAGTGYTAADISPQALAFLNLPAKKCPSFNDGTFCIPTRPGTAGFNSSGKLNKASVSASGLGTFVDHQFVAAVDKQLTPSDKLSIKSFYSNNQIERPFGTASSLPFAKALPGFNRFIKLGETHIFSSSVVVETHFGFNRFFFGQQPSEPILLADIGAVRGNSAQFPAAYRVSMSGTGFSIGTGVNDDRGGTFNTFNGGNDLSVTRGRHLVRIGWDFSRYQLNRFNNFAQRGNVTFGNTVADQFRQGDPKLVGFQNFLLGHITTTQAGAGFSSFHFRALDFSGYLQDDFKIRPRLTLNLGIRWEGMSTAHELNNFLSNFAGNGDGTSGPLRIVHPQATPNVGTPGVSSCTLNECFSAGNWAPRVGFAWDIFGDQKTVLRSGYGVYFQRISNQSLLQTSGGLPFSQAVSAAPFSVTTANPFPSILPNSAFPLPIDQVVPALTGFNGSTGAPIFQSANGRPLSGFFFFPVRNLRPPYAQQWNMSVERQLFKGWVLEVAYVGTKGTRLLGPGDPVDAGRICTNARPCIIPANIGANVNVPAGTPFVTKNSDGTIGITASTPDNIDARVPVADLGLANSRLFAQTQGGGSNYHSLQTTLRHRFSSGLYLQGAYTWSKSIDNGSGSTFTDELNGLVGFGDLFNSRLQRAVSDFDRTHRFVVSYNYELPFAKMFHIADRGFGRAVNGWSINGVTTFQSGTPFGVFDSSALTLQDTDGENGTNFATLAPGRTLRSALLPGSVHSRIGAYLDPSAFLVGGNCVDNQNKVVPSPGAGACSGFAAVGNVGRNTFRGPFQQNWDLSINKTTKITEKYAVELRGEFFNAFNHPSFQSPQAQGGSLGNYGLVDVSSGDSSIFATVNSPRVIQFALKFQF